MSLVQVLIFAFLFGARESTGVVLPMLLVGDVCAVRIFHQHARWAYVRRMLPPACLGVIIAAIVMRGLSEAVYKPIIGVTILSLTRSAGDAVVPAAMVGQRAARPVVRLDDRSGCRCGDDARQRGGT